MKSNDRLVQDGQEDKRNENLLVFMPEALVLVELAIEN